MKIRNNNIVNNNNNSVNNNNISSNNHNIEKLEAQVITTDSIDNMSPKKEDISRVSADIFNARNLKMLFCFIGLQVKLIKYV